MAENDMYVVKATVFGEKGRILSRPMTKMDADAFADRLKESMQDIDDELKAYSDIKVGKYKEEALYLNKDGVNPYSLLDDISSRIK